jgi:hypothetical protein
MDEREEGWIIQGNHFYHKGDYHKALECYSKAVSHENDVHAAWNIHNRCVVVACPYIESAGCALVTTDCIITSKSKEKLRR